MVVDMNNVYREALEPFAKAADMIHPAVSDDCTLGQLRRVLFSAIRLGDLRRARTAYDAIGAGVKVRALEWDEHGSAKALGLRYEVWLHRDVTDGYKERWLAAQINGATDRLGGFDSRDEANAAAQADFERRVLACLTHTAAGAGPVGEAGMGGIISEWQDAYRAFVGAFDTAVARMRSHNEYEQDARRRLRDFNDRILARPVEEPGEVERLMRERDAAMEREVKRAVTLRQRIDDMRCEIAEMRKHLEKLLEAVGKARTALAGFTSADDAAFALDVAISEIKRVAGHPVEEPDEVAHASAERAEKAEAALAETRKLFRDVRDNGLTYWEPQTSRGSVEKAKMFQRIDAALTGDAQEAGQ